MHRNTPSVSAYRCISEFLESGPLSQSPNWLNRGIQVHLQSHLITTSKQTSQFHDYGCQMHLQTCWFTASKCISKHAKSWPASVSPIWLDKGLKVHLWVIWSPSPSESLSSLYHDLPVCRKTHLNMASKCISKVTWLQPASLSLSNLISASRSIFKLTRSWPPNRSLSSTWSWPPISSRSSLHHCLHVHFRVHLILPPSLFPNSLDHAIQVNLRSRSSRPRNASLSRLNWGRLVLLQWRLSTVCTQIRCICISIET